MSKSNKIRHIVRIRQMLQRWHMKAKSSSSASNPPPPSPPSDVPSGHVAVVVGSNCTRYIVRATYLNHPVFKTLLVEAEEEYGFTHSGPLTIPCDVSVFEDILLVVSRSESCRFLNFDDVKRCCHVSSRRSNAEFLCDAMPLLHG